MYRGCTHSLAAPSPVSILLVVCSALHHTAVSRVISGHGGHVTIVAVMVMLMVVVVTVMVMVIMVVIMVVVVLVTAMVVVIVCL